jgi:hypothetical protein
MPFKGDMRLGGPHDNEAKLNGTSDGPSVPVAGTVLGWEERPIIISVAVDEWLNEDIEIGTGVFNLVADGLGGTYEELVDEMTVYVPEGEWVGPRIGFPEPQVSQYDSESYYNGQYVVGRYVSDGVGGVTLDVDAETYGDFFTYGTPVTGAPEFEITYQTSEHPSNWPTEQVPNGRYNFDTLEWDGTGGIYMGTGNMHVGGEYYPDGTLQSDEAEVNVEVPEGSGNYFFDGRDNRWEWDGEGNIVLESGDYYPEGTHITNYADYDYYWDGTGGFYSTYAGDSGGGGDEGGGDEGQFEGAVEAYGTYTGNSGTEINYIEISGTAYANGTYDYTEYHDGEGGTFTDNVYTYAEEHTFFGSVSVEDQDGNFSDVYYYSDGAGSYYTSNA